MLSFMDAIKNMGNKLSKKFDCVIRHDSPSRTDLLSNWSSFGGTRLRNSYSSSSIVDDTRGQIRDESFRQQTDVIKELLNEITNLRKEVKVVKDESRLNRDDINKNHLEQYSLLKKETVIFSQLLDEKDSLVKQLEQTLKATEKNLEQVRAKLKSTEANLEICKRQHNCQIESHDEQLHIQLDEKQNEINMLCKELQMKDSEIIGSRKELEIFIGEHEKTLKDLESSRNLIDEIEILQAELNQMKNDQNYDSLLKKYKKEMLLRKRYYNQLIEIRGNIRVYCRIRPVIDADLTKGTCLHVNPHDDSQIILTKDKTVHAFEADKVFSIDSTQDDVFNEIKPLITSCIDGFNVCIMAYGQTSAGKTFTMDGPPNNPGLSSRALNELFQETEQRPSWKFQLTVSAFEIYNDRVRDLLSDKVVQLIAKLDPIDGVYMPAMTAMKVESLEDINKIFTKGRNNRAMASTLMNETSSRSHQILTIRIESENVDCKLKNRGILYLVDLAGSERLNKSGMNSERIKEAIAINYSLSCLGDVVNALRNKSSHIPYRNSRLTFVLKDCLGGNAKTALIVNVAPNESNVNESMASLMFAQKTRGITSNGHGSKKLYSI